MFSGKDLISLKSISNISTGQSSPYDDEFSKTGIPFIKAGNLEDLKLGHCREDECNLVSETMAHLKKLRIHNAGTVLIAKSGMSCLSGHVYALKKPAYIVSHLACIEPLEGKSTTEFLKWYFITYGIKGLIKDPSYPSIQLEQLANLYIPNASVENQNQFADFALQSDKSKFYISQAYKNIKIRRFRYVNI
jgi:type I restriction enzyme S subunit